jgi:TetR/AcrR family transcriptional repressor of nem operon
MMRPRRSEKTREALIEIGIEQLSVKGYHGTGIKQILDAVNVPKGSFYNYFPSKEAFVAEIIRAYSAQGLQQLDAYVDQSDDEPLQKIKTIYEFMLEKFVDQHCQRGCLIGSLAAEMGNQSELCQSAMLQSVANWKRRVTGLIRQAQLAGAVRDDLSAEQITSVFWAAWEGSLLKMKMEGDVTPARETLYLMLDHLFKPAAEAVGRRNPENSDN